MSRLYALLILVALTRLGGAQHEPPDHSAEIYALASASGGGDVPAASAAAGFCLGGAWQPFPRFGVVADFDRHFVSDTHLSFNTYMVGPRFYSEEHSHLSAFYHVLTGVRQTGRAGQPTAWNYVLAPGVGLDVRLRDGFVWRLGQVDATLTRSGGILRVSSGFVFRFGY